MLRAVSTSATRTAMNAAAAVGGVSITSAATAASASVTVTVTRSLSTHAATVPSPYPAGRDRHLVRPSDAAIASGRGYEALCRDFTWPHQAAGVTHYNIGVDISDKWAAQPDKRDTPALIFEDAEGNGEVVSCSFGESARLSNLLGWALTKGLGVEKGDRVAILMSQSIETALVHTAVYKSGGVAVPLFILFGPEALEYRLMDSGAKVVCVEQSKVGEVLALKAAGKLPDLQHVVVAPPLSAMRFETIAPALESNPASVCDAPLSPRGTVPSATVACVHHMSTLLATASASGAATRFKPAQTLLDDPALIIYTSGTTGPPKGALHAHRVLLGHLPGVEFPQEFFPVRPSATDPQGDLFWTPADWAWIGGLIDVLLPSLHHGVPVYACRFKKFDPELAFDIIERRGVRNMFMPPTALKLMRTVSAPEKRWPGMRVRSIGSGGESLGESLLEWGRQSFSGVNINEFYGQTECNLVLGNCSTLFPARAGCMGKAIPGHTVRVVSAEGVPLPDGEVGNIGVLAPHPVMMLRYWNKPRATAEKYAGDYLLTGDLAKRDSDGYFSFFGRADDVIKSSGYRIGPAEIEECLMKHADVANVAAIGVPDELRGERVKVYIVLRPDSIAKSETERTVVQARKHRPVATSSVARCSLSSDEDHCSLIACVFCSLLCCLSFCFLALFFGSDCAPPPPTAAALPPLTSLSTRPSAPASSLT